jgi:hypothetical protein
MVNVPCRAAPVLTATAHVTEPLPLPPPEITRRHPLTARFANYAYAVAVIKEPSGTGGRVTEKSAMPLAPRLAINLKHAVVAITEAQFFRQLPVCVKSLIKTVLVGNPRRTVKQSAVGQKSAELMDLVVRIGNLRQPFYRLGRRKKRV